MAIPSSFASRPWLWGPVGAQMTIIFAASSVPDLGALPGGTPDWVGHGAGYAILGALLLRALSGGRRSGVTPGAVLTAVAGAVLYGASDEWHQTFVHGRSAGLGDLAADAAGAALAAALGWIWAHWSSRRESAGMP